jgi:acetaldehyde dehydrogenase (acetylating)
VLVQLGIFVVPSSDVSVVSEGIIEVENLPDVTGLGIVFDTTSSGCGAGEVRDIPTAVDVMVTNFPGSCSDTLVAAFIVEPFDQACYTP